MYRHQPLTHLVESVVHSGRLGPVRSFKGAFTFALTREGDVRFDFALGGGSLWDIGCYPVSYSCMLAGAPPREVFGWQQTSDTGIDLEFAGMMRFADGSVAQFDCGFVGPFRAEMEVVGRDAALRIERPFRTDELSRLILAAGDEREILPFPASPPFSGEIADMEAAVLDATPPRVSLAESRRTILTLSSLYESARRGRPVHL